MSFILVLQGHVHDLVGTAERLSQHLLLLPLLWTGAGQALPWGALRSQPPLSQSVVPLLTSFTVASFVLINPGPSLVLAEFPVTIFSRELSIPFMLPYSKFRCLPCPVGHRVSQRQRYTPPHTRAHPCTGVPWKHEFTRVSRSFQAWLLRVCGPNVFTFSWWLLLLFWLAETDRFKNFEMIFF